MTPPTPDWRREAETLQAELARSQERFRLLIQHIPDILWTVDLGGRTVFMSPQVDSFCGYTADEIAAGGRDLWFSRVHPDDRAAVEKAGKDLVTAGTTYDTNYRFRKKNGDWMWIRSRSTPPYEKDGRRYADGIFSDITAAKRAEEDLRASEIKYHSLVERLPDHAWTIDADGRALFLGGRLEPITGFTPEEIQAGGTDLWVARVHADDRARVAEAVTVLFRHDKPLDVEYRFQRKDGAWIWLRSRSEGPYVKDGRRCADGVASDVTERKAAEAALQRQTTILSAVVENIGEGLVVADTQGKFILYNPAATRMVGIGAQEEPMEKWPKHYGAFLPDGATLFPPHDMPIARAVRGESCDEVEMFIRNANVPDGVLISLTGRPLRDAAGTLLGGVVVFRDVTEHRRAHETRERLAAIVEGSDDAILSKDLNGVIRSWNRGAERLYGYAAAEAIGQPVSILEPPERRGEIDGLLRRLKAGERVTAFETVRLRKDGKRLSISLSVSPLRDAGGAVVGASTIARDIGPRKGLEEQLRQSQKMDAVGRLAGGVAHDFNNMLTAILGFANILKRRMDAADARREDVEQIITAAEQAGTITRQLLAFSRRQAVQPVVLNINDCVKNVGGMLKRLIGERIRVEVVLQERLGQTRVDTGQIEQVLLNLAINARDAMPDGGKLTIETADVDLDLAYTGRHVGMRPGPYVLLAVSDTGTGMDAETMGRIFEPFFTTKEKGKGTGLGLSIVYGVAKQSGGEVWVYSEPGKGTTFKIYLPRVDAPTAARTLPPGTLPHGKETVLLVEDEDAVARLATKVLSGCGYNVRRSGTAEDALRLDGTGPVPDLLVTDVVLPGISGRALADRLRAARPALKVLYMSGYPDNAGALLEALEPGAAFLQKPFTPETLSQKVRAVLDETAGHG